MSARLSVAQAGRDDVRAMLIGALGCNIASGIIDAALYLRAALGELGRNLSLYPMFLASGSRPSYVWTVGWSY